MSLRGVLSGFCTAASLSVVACSSLPGVIDTQISDHRPVLISMR